MSTDVPVLSLSNVETTDVSESSNRKSFSNRKKKTKDSSKDSSKDPLSESSENSPIVRKSSKNKDRLCRTQSADSQKNNPKKLEQKTSKILSKSEEKLHRSKSADSQQNPNKIIILPQNNPNNPTNPNNPNNPNNQPQKCSKESPKIRNKIVKINDKEYQVNFELVLRPYPVFIIENKENVIECCGAFDKQFNCVDLIKNGYNVISITQNRTKYHVITINTFDEFVTPIMVSIIEGKCNIETFMNALPHIINNDKIFSI